jgi:hypothetical protein
MILYIVHVLMVLQDAGDGWCSPVVSETANDQSPDHQWSSLSDLLNSMPSQIIAQSSQAQSLLTIDGQAHESGGRQQPSTRVPNLSRTHAETAASDASPISTEGPAAALTNHVQSPSIQTVEPQPDSFGGKAILSSQALDLLTRKQIAAHGFLCCQTTLSLNLVGKV